jgi:hypothetical protein
MSVISDWLSTRSYTRTSSIAPGKYHWVPSFLPT